MKENRGVVGRERGPGHRELGRARRARGAALLYSAGLFQRSHNEGFDGAHKQAAALNA